MFPNRVFCVVFQNELDKVKAQLSMKGEFQLPAGDQQPAIGGSWALSVLGALSSPEEPLRRAHLSLKPREWCRLQTVLLEIFPKRDHLKLYKAPMTEPESAAWPSSAVIGERSASLET